MVLLLNLLPYLLAIGFGLAWWKTRKHWLLLIGALVLIVYSQAQPSYVPKGEVTRTELPAFESSKAEIMDSNRKPESSEVRNARQAQEYKDGLPFIEK